MELATGVQAKVGVWDLETMLENFDFGVLDTEKNEWIEFNINKNVNDLYKIVNFCSSKHFEYLCGFNSVDFDHQVMEYILRNYSNWYDFNGMEVAKKISEFVQNHIDNQKYRIPVPYKETHFFCNALDPFKIHHLDNEAKLKKMGMASLKWCAFMLNMDVEEMPIHHLKTDLSDNEIEMTRMYRRNDCVVTKAILDLTLGIVPTTAPELLDYEGKNKIEDRFNIREETGMECLNWSDVKIGEEWNKLEYILAEKVEDERSLFPRRVIQPYGKKFKQFFPKTMQFTSTLLQEFTKSLGERLVLADKEEYPVKIGETTYRVTKGGIHSTEKNRATVVPSGMILKDADVGAQYPSSIMKLQIYPPHLKETIIINFGQTIEMKDKYKQLGKEAEVRGEKKEVSRLKGLEGGTKLRMNGGYYGKLGQQGSFLEFPEGLLKVCMGNQLEILMLVEMLENVGFQVLSGNTDGILTLIRKEQEQQYFDICKAWEEKVGNTKIGKLEYTDFDGLWQESVNSYIGKKSDGKVKKKGRFVTVYGSPGCEINKNKSRRIIPLALEEYFIHKRDPIDFIKKHTSIFDFCIAVKASGQLHYEEQWEQGDTVKTKVHKKLVRYFVSNSGTVLYKRGFAKSKKGFMKKMNNHCEAINKNFPELGQPLVTYFNKAYEVPFPEYDINYHYYIVATLERIDAIEKTRKADRYVKSILDKKQGSLF